MAGLAKLTLRLALGMASLSLVALVFVAHQMNGAGTRPAVGKERVAGREAQTVAYFDHGQGEPVVLLAGIARSVSDFNELVEALAAAGFRSLAVESRGIGRTAGGGPFAAGNLHELAGDVLRVLRDVRLPESDPVHVVGHGFGTRVARMLAVDAPERVASLVLLAPGGRSAVEAGVGRAVVLSALPFLPWALREPSLRLAHFADDSAIPDSWRRGWWIWGGIGQAAAADATRSSEFWGGGAAPMLVVQAAEDRIAPPEASGRLLAAEYPDRVVLREISGAGHALLPERPDAVRDVVVSFLSDRRQPGS